MVRLRSPRALAVAVLVIAACVAVLVYVVHIQDRLQDIMLSQEGQNMMKEEEGAMGGSSSGLLENPFPGPASGTATMLEKVKPGGMTPTESAALDREKIDVLSPTR